jgi:hypothetical protein
MRYKHFKTRGRASEDCAPRQILPSFVREVCVCKAGASKERSVVYNTVQAACNERRLEGTANAYIGERSPITLRSSRFSDEGCL